MSISKYFLLCFFLLSTSLVFAQVDIIYGRITSKDTNDAIPGVYVINKNSEKETTTNGLGLFKIEAKQGDTLIFSHMSYAYTYYVIKGQGSRAIQVELAEKNFLLQEVSVFAYKLTTNEPRAMKIGKPSIPNDEEIELPGYIQPGISSPVDYFYDLFGSKPKQMRELRRLIQEDYYRRKLLEGNNRTIVAQLTGLTKEELEAFMFFCKYSNTRIQLLNDYEYIESLLDCYDEYVRQKEIDQILIDQEENNR